MGENGSITPEDEHQHDVMIFSMRNFSFDIIYS
jgi:hypothetical protein